MNNYYSYLKIRETTKLGWLRKENNSEGYFRNTMILGHTN